MKRCRWEPTRPLAAIRTWCRPSIVLKPHPTPNSCSAMDPTRNMTNIAHIRCGDDMRPAFAQSGLPGRFVRWADPLCEGPTPAKIGGARWRAVRAGYASERYGVTLNEAETFLDDQDVELAEATMADEIVLWFEHDQFDQVILIHLLDWFAARKVPTDRLSIICIDKYPGIDPFHGIGQLDAAALNELFPRRVPVTKTQVSIARRAWKAFRSADPRPLEAMLTQDISALPFLAGALLRHFEDFPDRRDGLGRTERQIMLAAQGGDQSAAAVFGGCQAMEEARWCGDTMFWGWLRAMAEARMPALAIVGSEDWWRQTDGPHEAMVGLTRAGHALLRGAADWARMGGVERWMGGVHLEGRDPAWRWDAANRRLVEGGARD